MLGLSLGLSLPISVTADVGKDVVLPDMFPEVDILVVSGRGGTGGGRFRLIGTGGGSLVVALGVFGADDMGREAAGLSINPKPYRKQKTVAVWLSGSVVGQINEVTLHRAGLMLRWVTVRGVYHLGV